jgi:cyclopropane-fatty-acyl-phospholipid synthase
MARADAPAAPAPHRVFHGSVYHHRLAPADHAFHYPVCFFAFDVDTLDRAPAAPWFGYNRRALATLRDRDYLDDPATPLAAKARRFLNDPRIARIDLVTVPRILGTAFNPVSFHLGRDASGRILAALAEVNNTFGERHVYALSDPSTDPQGFLHFAATKAFHVSPFNDRLGDYQFRLREQDGRLEIHIDIARDGAVVFRSGLVARTAAPLTTGTLLGALARFPFQNLLTLPRIHLQAARLYFQKKMRYFPKPGPDSAMTIQIAPPTFLEKTGRRIFNRLLTRLNTGRLAVTTPDGVTRNYGPGGDGPTAAIRITDYTFYRRILLDGDIGLGEAYMYGQWTTPDLTGLIAYLIANRDALENGELASARLKWLLHRISHLLRSNTKRASRKNISAHYDLSNAFFQLFLDPTMLYSSGLYLRPDDTLEQAQHNKMQALIRRAGIQAHHHVLEIGSGWGGMAIEMARTTGCRVTSITISEQQLSLARERVAAAGLTDRVRIEFCDYRDVQGSFDRVVSIEMLEAVGHEHFDSYFSTIDRVLVPDGRAAIQVITIPHERYDAYRNSVDWIQKHIFPGGHLPSVEALAASMHRVSALRIVEHEDIGPHYATTLRAWSDNLAARRADLTRLGYDDVFYRTWQYYFSYCEAAFATRTLGDHHLVLARG